MKKYICKLCYREFEVEDMAKTFSGVPSEYCRTCNNIIGKGAGYANAVSDEQAEEWFKGASKREAKLIKEKKICQ